MINAPPACDLSFAGGGDPGAQRFTRPAHNNNDNNR